MSAQPTLQPNHKVHRYVTSTVWNTGLAKRCQIYNIFRTNIKIYKKNIDKVNQQGHLQVLYARKALCHFRYRYNARRLSQCAERNRKIDALRLRYDRQTSCLFRLAPLGNTVAVSRLQPFSVSLRKPEDSTLLSPTAPEGP